MEMKHVTFSFPQATETIRRFCFYKRLQFLFSVFSFVVNEVKV